VSADRKTIGLCMIVKDEAHVILGCLESVRPFVDCVLIEDTGSSDGTQTVIREWLSRVGLPGEVYDEPWRGFAYNRSHALARLRENKSVDYALIIDADDVLEVPPGFKMPRLKVDSYTLEIRHQELCHWRPHLLRNALPWRYEGVLHEFLSCPVGPDNRRTFPEERSQQRLAGVRIRIGEEGARRQASARELYRRDAALLERALATETDPFLISRYTFYLAQSYRDCGEREKALANYLKRAELGFWDHEVFISLYQAANLKADLGYQAEDVLATYSRAHNVRKDHAEALHGAANFCRVRGRFPEGYEFAHRALGIKAPADALFLELWVYDYGLLDEFAVNAYWTGRYAECVDACDRLLGEGKLPPEMRDRVLKNQAFAVDKLREAAAPASPESDAFTKLLRATRKKERLADSDDEVVSAYLEASAACPTRAEALHGAARFCRNKGMHERGYQCAAQGVALAYPKDALGVEDWIYEYGLLDELAVNAYWTGRYKECADACDRLITDGKLPIEERNRVLKNRKFAIDKLQKAAAQKAATDNQRKQRNDECRSPSPAPSSRQNPTLHVLGVPHTIPHEDYLVCAFTAKVLLFPEVIQPFGWDVIEYSNQGSDSKAREHVVILAKDRLRALSQRRSREEPHDADVNNADLKEEFQRVLLDKIRSHAKPGDIVCHVWGPNMEVYDLLRDCHHIELSVGYTASPGLPFRVYESSAWMHWHYGKAGQEDGNNYKWVIPSALDAERWTFHEKPDDYALFVGRVTPRKGLNTIVEIARRMPELPILVHGPGDPSPWATEAPPNLLFKGPIFGAELVDVVQRAGCMLMPTNFIEPFGFSGIEAQLCGVPLIAASYGAFHETVVEGITGYRCHTLADWVEAIRISKSLDRRHIATLACGKYSKEVVGKQYDWALKQLADLSGRGWYADKSRKFGSVVVSRQEDTTEKPPRKPRIWIYIPYFGAFPNYFQLYLDSLGENADCLSVFLMTDNDLSGYRLPNNLIPIQLTLGALRKKAARFINGEFGMTVQPDELMKRPYKLVDFKVIYLELFREISEQYGVTYDDFIGWGDCDLIYGRFSDFLNMKEDYQIIGGFHGHFTAFRNIDSFRKLFKQMEGLSRYLLDEKFHIVDEIAFRKPLLDLLETNEYRMFYINRYFCDIVPECFFGLFRQDHARRKKNFFDVYHPDKEIDYVRYDGGGRLTVVYEDGDSRQSIYCHLQKRAMLINFDRHENGYYIREDAFRLKP
jgi:glycosyltransferase involved in cell wall biosynthesis